MDKNNLKKHKRLIGGIALCLGQVFSVNAATNDNDIDNFDLEIERNYRYENIGGWESTPLSEVKAKLKFNPYVSVNLGVDLREDVFTHSNDDVDLINIASVSLNTGNNENSLLDNWNIELGLIGREYLFNGAFGRKNDAFLAPLSAAEAFLVEELNNLVGVRINRTIHVSNNWSWSTNLTIGKTKKSTGNFTLKDSLDFVFDHDINTAPRLRKELHKLWRTTVSKIDPTYIDKYYPDLEAEGARVIDEISAEDLRYFFEKAVKTIGTYFPEYYEQEITRKEFATVVTGSALDYTDLGANVISDLWGKLRTSQADSNKNSFLLKTEFSRVTDNSCFTFGIEGGQIYSDGVGDKAQTNLGIYSNMCRNITDNIEWKFAIEIAGMKNYLNLDDIDNAIGAAYTQVEWEPKIMDDLKLHYGAGKSYSALFGNAIHQEIGAVYDFIKNKNTIVSTYATIGKIDSKPTILGHDTLLGRDSDIAYNVGMNIKYRF